MYRILLSLIKKIIDIMALLIAKIIIFFEIIYGKKGTLFLKESIEKNLSLTLENEGIIFDISHKGLYYRASTLITKEPDTIEWINNFFKKGEVFYDIGANIGVFSLYAASKKHVKVYAFEAESSNYSYLNKNINLNGLEEEIVALNIAINDVNIVSHLNLSSISEGAALHNFHNDIDQEHKQFKPVFKQGLLGLSLDYIIDKLNVDAPNHIKIDVDGAEHRIINGAIKLLSNNNLKTICIEINPRLELDLEVVNILNECGFSLLKGEKYLNKECVKNKQPYNMFFVRE